MGVILVVGEGARLPGGSVWPPPAARGITARHVDTLSEAVRVLSRVAASLIVVDHAALRLGPRGTLDLLGQVAPGVPVAIVVGPDVAARVQHELDLAGCRILRSPVTAADLVHEARVTCASRADV